MLGVTAQITAPGIASTAPVRIIFFGPRRLFRLPPAKAPTAALSSIAEVMSPCSKSVGRPSWPDPMFMVISAPDRAVSVYPYSPPAHSPRHIISRV